MKNLFLTKTRWLVTIILLTTLGSGNAWGADVTYFFSEQGYSNGEVVTNGSIDTYSSWSATKGGSNDPKYYDTGTGLRVYNGGTFTITSSKTLSNITLTFSGNSYTFASGTNTPIVVSPNATSYEWSVSQTCRLQKIEITYGGGGGGCSNGKVTNIGQLNVGDEIILYYESGTKELSAVGSGRGDGTDYSGSPAGVYPLIVEAGSVTGTYSFKHGSDGYLCNTDGGNNLNLTATKAQNSSWTVSFSSNNAVITNSRYDTKIIMWNSSSPRFSCYASGTSNTHAIQMYKICACSSNPTMANATTGVGFSLSSIPVTVSDLVVGAGCEWTDAGFVWSATSTTPSLQSNGNASANCTKVQIKTSGSDASYSGNLTGSFATNTPYYFRAYGKNSYASATYQYSPTVSTVYLQSISYNANGGSGSMADQIIKRNQATTSRSNTFTRTGYTFNGWNTNPDGTSGTNYANQALITTTTNLTLYAKWAIQSYTLTWNLNGGTVTVAGTGAAVNATGSPSSSVNYGAPITVPTVVKEGNTFTGWNTTPASTMPATNTTYTAQWTPNQYTVTWKSNGGVARTDNNVNHGSSLTAPTISPLPCGDKLVGWTDAINGEYIHGTSTLYEGATPAITITDNKVFYAVFADYVTP